MPIFIVVTLIFLHAFVQQFVIVLCVKTTISMLEATESNVDDDLKSSSRACEANANANGHGSASGSANANANGIGRNAFAVVAYDDSKVLDLHRKERSFQFGRHHVVIEQRWQTVGVAAVVWDAAIVLGEYLCQHRDIVAEKHVLELGAGTGLTGILAAMLGANVVLTDRQMALPTLRENVARNRRSCDGDTLTLRVRELEWGRGGDVLAGPYDVVLGADIVYIEDTFALLLQTLVDVTSAHTLVLLSCKIRYDRDRRFLALLRRQFEMEEIVYDSARDIRVYAGSKIS